MHFYRGEKIALFIDGANLHQAAKALGFTIDFRKLLSHFRQKAQLIRAHYYTVLKEDQFASSIRPLIDWLDYNGFTVITKPAKELSDAGGRLKVKGKMDVELAVEALRFAAHVDHIVLFTGDSDFCALVAALQEKGTRVSVVSTLETRPSMVAAELRRQADHFIDLADLEAEIAQERSHSGAEQKDR